VLFLPFASQAWPSGLLSIDIDLVDHSSADDATLSALGNLAPQRVALLLRVSDAATPGLNASVEARATALQSQFACSLLAQLLPSALPQVCALEASKKPSSVTAGFETGAVFAADVVARDGSVAADAFNAQDSISYLPFSFERAATASDAGTLAWGGGLVPRNSGWRRSVTAVTDEFPFAAASSLGSEAHTQQRSFRTFFGRLEGTAGLLGEALQKQRAAYIGEQEWTTVSLHASITPAPGQKAVRVAIAETAVTKGPASFKDSAALAALGSRCKWSGATAEGPALHARFAASLSSWCTAPAEKQSAGLIAEWLRPGSTHRPVAWSSRVCRTVRNTGLHRELEYKVQLTATVDAQTLARFKAASGAQSGSAAQPSTASNCHLLLVQRVERSMYLDLDEVRERARGDPLDLDGASANDLERRKAFLPGPALRAFSKFIDVERPASVSTEHVVLLALPIQGSEDAVATGRFGRAIASVAAAGTSVTVDASFHELVHARYQSPGCHKDNALGPSASSESPALAHYADGSFRFPAPRATTGASNASSGSLFLAQAAGCYKLAHLPLPTVHVQCAAPSDGTQSSGSASLSALQAATTASAPASEAAATWVQVPVRNSAVLGAKRCDGACVAPLSAVPVGNADDFAVVGTATALAALSAAALLVALAALTTSRRRMGTKAHSN
jgi:hypothetical protein